MRRLSAARTSTPAAATLTRQQSHTLRFTKHLVSQLERERHARAPERQLLRTDAQSLDLSADAPEASGFPIDSDPFRQETCNPAAEIRRTECADHLKAAHQRIDPGVHEAGATDQVGPQGIAGDVPWYGDHDVSGQGRHTATCDELAIAGLKKSWCPSDVGVEAEDFAEPLGARAERRIRVACGMLRID